MNRPPLPYPLALSGRLQRGSVGVFLGFCAVASIGILYPMLQRHLYPFVADRRATARTTETLSHAASRQKKRRGRVGSQTENEGAVPVRCTVVMGFRDTTDGECVGTGTRRSDKLITVTGNHTMTT